jgi:2-dehydro-3-deoxyphosphooctonate aldolase (KDO 8-P synthase)
MRIQAKAEPVKTIQVADIEIGAPGKPLAVIAGLCVIESRDHTLRIAHELREISERVGLPLIFKASYDKANRTSLDSYRGPGMEEGLSILAAVNAATGLPIITDVHEPSQCAAAAEVADILQIPAFLCRQTDLLLAAAATELPVAVKKAQHMAPEDMSNVVNKLRGGGCAEGVLLTERGSVFGYRQLVNDFRGLEVMRGLGCPVCFDATHSVQVMGGRGTSSGGAREFIPLLARTAAAAGIDALFLETHDNPDKALSDGPNALPLEWVEPLLRRVREIDELVRRPLMASS